MSGRGCVSIKGRFRQRCRIITCKPCRALRKTRLYHPSTVCSTPEICSRKKVRGTCLCVPIQPLQISGFCCRVHIVPDSMPVKVTFCNSYRCAAFALSCAVASLDVTDNALTSERDSCLSLPLPARYHIFHEEHIFDTQSLSNI